MYRAAIALERVARSAFFLSAAGVERIQNEPSAIRQRLCLQLPLTESFRLGRESFEGLQAIAFLSDPAWGFPTLYDFAALLTLSME